MSELSDIIWVEKYRPKKFDDLICDNKDRIINLLKSPKSMPSLVLHSSRPGTGKTTTAKLIASALGCDFKQINASDERGIDTIREQVRSFAQSMSSIEGIKRFVFLDEADGLTKQAQESMKSMMEDFSSNCFFALSCNDVSKIIEPIKSRCIEMNFERPDKNSILKRLEFICKEEKLDITTDELKKLIETSYPDIRAMINVLQLAKLDSKKVLVDVNSFEDMLTAMRTKNVQEVYKITYSGNFDLQGFVRYFFNKLFLKTDKVALDKLARIAILLADIEKNWNIGVNYEIAFISNILEIMLIT